MPSLLHEGILELIRERPEFVASLLRDLLHVEVPAFTAARLADAALTQLLPTEYRADAVVLLVDDRPVFGCIFEVQLSEDSQKLFSWPMYAVSARARYECPFVLIVVTPAERIASWAARPIALGGGQVFTPLVLGPQGIPIITDQIVAIADPELALLSALTHAENETEWALPVTVAALAGVASMPAEQQVIYFHLLKAAVGNAARKAFEMLPHRLHKYLSEDDQQRMREARAEGQTQELTLNIFKVLDARGVLVSEDIRARIAAKSHEELRAIFDRSLRIASAEELLE